MSLNTRDRQFIKEALEHLNSRAADRRNPLTETEAAHLAAIVGGTERERKAAANYWEAEREQLTDTGGRDCVELGARVY